MPFTGYRPILTVRLPLWPLAVFALIADVAPLRRSVSEECYSVVKVLSDLSDVTYRYNGSLRQKQTNHSEAGRPFCSEKEAL